MLSIAKEREVDGGVLLNDLGQGISFKAGAFDGEISISALQWLYNSDKSMHKPVKRLYQFFSTLFAAMCTARVVLQFYPEKSCQIELITVRAKKSGFFGGVVIDYPNSTKAKKFFLVLMTGDAAALPKALGEESASEISYTYKRDRLKKLILAKKEKRRRQGKEVCLDSKYSGRRRCGKF